MNNMFKMLSKLMGHGKRNLGNIPTEPLTRKQLRKLRPPRYRPAFSMGYRGFPKTEQRPGTMTAPTIDQVRHLERKRGVRLQVRRGLITLRDGTFLEGAS